MNNTLSTFIAFAGFLVVFSVLVTSLQETIKNLLKLKAGVWERFFFELYKKEFLGDKKKNNKLDFIPDYWSRPFIGEFDERLKRLKRIIVLADTSIRKLQTDINNLDMEDLTRHSLKKIIETTQQIKMLNLDSLLKIFDQFGRSDLKKLKEKISAFEKSVTDYFEAKDDALKIIEKAIANHCNELKTEIINTIPEISEYKLKLELKADAWIEQINCNYKKNMHKWTFFIGLVFVFICNADAFSIYQHLKVNPELRESIIQLANKPGGEKLNLNADQLNDIQTSIAEAKKENPKTLEKLNEIQSGLTAAAGNFIKDYNQFNLPLAPLNNFLDALKETEAEMKAKITAANKKLDVTPYLKLLNSYYSKLAVLFVTFQRDTLQQQLKTVTDTELPLGWSDDFKNFKIIGRSIALMWFIIPKLGGLLLTSFLITFGAPFWRDVLTALVGIKSTGLKNPSK